MPEGYIVLQSARTAATCCSARTSRATAKPTSPRPPRMEAPEDLPLVGGSQAAADEVHRREGRRCSIRRSLRREFFEYLDRIVQNEPWLERDRAMIDPLRTLGIRRASPSPPTGDEEGARRPEPRGAVLARAVRSVLPPFFEGSRWSLPVLPGPDRAASRATPIRTTIPSTPAASPTASASSASSGSAAARSTSRHRGQGRREPRRRRDLPPHVPPEVPIEQYWSVTAYDRETHALIGERPREPRLAMRRRAEEPRWVGRYLFGPKGPPGKESNWVPTDPARGFELMFRLYAPDQGALRKNLDAAGHRGMPAG